MFMYVCIGIARMYTSVPRSILAPRFERVLHIVRSPYKHISSFTTHTNQSYNFVVECVKSWSKFDDKTDCSSNLNLNQSCQRGDRCNLPISVYSWLHWNKYLSKIADSVYRIEYEREKLLLDAVAYIKKRRHGDSYTRRLYKMVRPPRRVLEPSKYHTNHAQYEREDIKMDMGVHVLHHIDTLATQLGYTSTPSKGQISPHEHYLSIDGSESSTGAAITAEL